MSGPAARGGRGKYCLKNDTPTRSRFNAGTRRRRAICTISMRDANNRNAVAIRVIAPAPEILLIYSYFIHSYRSRRVRAMKMHHFVLFSPTPFLSFSPIPSFLPLAIFAEKLQGRPDFYDFSCFPRKKLPPSFTL